MQLKKFLSDKNTVTKYIIVIELIFTLIITLLILADINNINDTTIDLAKQEALAVARMQKSLHTWANSYHGVYVPVTENVQPNPNLNHIQDRDIETDSGLKLTLICPTTMLRENMLAYDSLYGIEGHITSLDSRRSEGAPDEWEREALQKFRKGGEEAFSISRMNGETYLRFILPLPAKKGCVRCHNNDNNINNAVLGGISVKLNMAEYNALKNNTIVRHALPVVILWLLASLGLIIAGRSLNKGFLKIVRKERELQQGHHELEQKVESRTLELTNINKKLENEIAERRQTEVSLQNSESVLNKQLKFTETLMNEIPTPLFYKDKSGTYLGCNPAFEKFTGKSREEIINKTVFDLWPAEQARVYARRDAELLENPVHQSYEFEVTNFDGEVRQVVFEKSVFYDENSRPAGIIGVYIDITDRKKIEKALKESQELLLETGKMAKVGGWEFDLNEQKLHWSEMTKKIHEVPDDFEPDIKNAVTFFAPDSKLLLEKAISNCIDHGDPYDLELKFHTAKNNNLWVRAIGKPIYENGKITAIRGTFQDVTARRAAIEELKNKEQLLRTMVESQGEGVGITDRNDVFIFANPAAEQLFGLESGQLVNRSLFDFLPEESIAIIETQNRLRKKKEKSSYEIDIIRDDGERITLLATVTPQIDSITGEVIGSFGVFRDFTEQRRIMNLIKKSQSQSTGLRGQIPICAGCHKIRDDEKSEKPWVSPADYINFRLPEVDFTHGFCPDCVQKWYPDLADESDDDDE